MANLKRVIEISSLPSRLSVKHKQLVLESDEREAVTIPLEDLGMLVVDQPETRYSHNLLIGLAEAGATVALCGPDHLPAALLLPLDGNTRQAERFRRQAASGAPVKKRLWQALIAAKISQQGLVLTAAKGRDEGLAALSGRVRSGDPDNLEAQAAQRYWPALLGRDFRRDRFGEPPNGLLNYGYAVLRAACARALVGTGLHPSLGIFHERRDNPFCLADDLIEPFRPYVDWRVQGLVETGHAGEVDRDGKRALLGLFAERVLVEGRATPLMLAIERAAQGLAAALAGDENAEAASAAQLVLPRGLPLRPGKTGEADGDNGQAGTD